MPMFKWIGKIGNPLIIFGSNGKRVGTEFHFEEQGFSEADRSKVQSGRWAICVSTDFGEHPLQDFHRQIKLLDAVIPNTPAVLDGAACSLHPGYWIRDLARTETPPNPINLFTIHSVYDPDHPKTPAWLHTHGLLRCKCIELELIGADFEYAGNLGNLINLAAMLFLDHGIAPPDHPFEIGGKMSLVWLPFETGIHKFPKNYLGGRDNRDSAHDHPSGVLFRRKGLGPFKRYSCPNQYGPLWEANPIVYISDEETARSTAMAKEKMKFFIEYFNRFQDSEDWIFLVKLGYPVDHPSGDFEHEHLWFNVHKIQDDQVDATLINEPYGIEKMYEGNRGWHDLQLLSDWNILCEHGSFTPDRIVILDHVLNP